MTIISWNNDSEQYFSHNGCENCNNHYGNNVEDCKLLESMTEEPVTVSLCNDCMSAYANGTELPSGCQNVYNI